MLKYIILVSLIFYFLPLQTQEYKVLGTITDTRTQEDLIGANIYEPKLKKGVVADKNGRYTFQLSKGLHTLQYSYTGYKPIVIEINLRKDTIINIQLAIESLEEVVVTDNPLEEKLKQTQMSLETISIEDIKTIPVIFGEADIIKVLQLKPGVASGGEGTSGLYVRGGGPDQNLVLLDNLQIYNASHLFGFFSIFNPDAVNKVNLYKGDFPAQFGGRLSSVLEVKQRKGSLESFGGSGGIGLISSRLTLETPLQKGKSSLLLSGRRTYFDIFTRIINRANEDNEDFDPIPDYYFYDLNTRLNYVLSDKDELSITGYFGRDIFTFQNDDFNFQFRWGNSAVGLNWQHKFNDKLWAVNTLAYTRYQYTIRNSFDVFSFSLGGDIQDFSAQSNLYYIPNEKHFITIGGQFTYHQFGLGRLSAESSDGLIDFGSSTELEGSEMGIYINDNIMLHEKWKMNLGLRISAFENRAKWFYGFEPRLAVLHQFTEKNSLKFSYARMFQYVHLVSNSGASLPTDLWYPSSRIVNPQVSDQVTLGYSHLLFDGKILISNEYYYKEMQNQLDLRDGAQIFVNPEIEQEFVFGRGWSYGTEVYVEKKQGKLRGWVGYTLSWTWRQFGVSNGNPAINEGRRFHPRYDRRHDVSAVLMYEISPRLTFSSAWVYGTGNAISLPTSRAAIQNIPGADFEVITLYEADRNSFRMPAYHRLDLGLIWKFFPKWGESDLTFSVYNAYSRRNAYFLYIEQIGEPIPTDFRARQVALFPIIPTLTYNFKF